MKNLTERAKEYGNEVESYELGPNGYIRGTLAERKRIVQLIEEMIDPEPYEPKDYLLFDLLTKINEDDN